MAVTGDHGATAAAPYRVLARTYRPTRLSELIGQEILVRALRNAFASGRIAHAFLLSGIRGIGKTTTARIIARALNCTGPDGKGEPTPEPCGVCSSCVAIAQDRPLDVIEMDAATRTGIDDIREIVDSVRYAPAASRYKIYIIDEVHMLSEKAFNGLLKTLEEPPPHAKFVFATTEARKLPITVLSRCQRFDLRRVEPTTLQDYLETVCAKEGIDAEPAALGLIARAAEGSVRDALSLTDQAIALSAGALTVPQVAGMLGVADRAHMLELLATALDGEGGKAVDAVRAAYDAGSDPVAVVQDLLELTHQLTMCKIERPCATDLIDHALSQRSHEIAGGQQLEVLSRAWQMLLKGLDEVRGAPEPIIALEMLLLRLASASRLPPPGELVRLLGQTDGAPPRQRLPSEAAQKGPAVEPALPGLADHGSAHRALAVRLQPDDPETASLPPSFEAMVALVKDAGEPWLAAVLAQSVHPVSYQPPRLALRPAAGLPNDFVARLCDALRTLTGQRWTILVENSGGEPTLQERADAERTRRMRELADSPDVARILAAVPGAEIVDVRRRRD